MGQDKCHLPFGETTLLNRVVGQVAQACAPVIVVARAASDYPDCGARVIGDRHPGAGPLGGLAAGLAAVETACAAVVACDTPFIAPALLRGLLGLARDWDAIVPVVAGRAQPLCAVYRREVATVAETILARGERAAHRLLAQPGLRVRRVPEDALRAWDPDLLSFVGINTPDDYDRARKMLTRSGPA
jgi:molybdopterin-guanine dinucleotide biosynthesis protein A